MAVESAGLHLLPWLKDSLSLFFQASGSQHLHWTDRDQGSERLQPVFTPQGANNFDETRQAGTLAGLQVFHCADTDARAPSQALLVQTRAHSLLPHLLTKVGHPFRVSP